MTEAVVLERRARDDGVLQLQRRGDDYEIVAKGIFLMATYDGASERALVRSACGTVKHPSSVLLAGLGVGLSLREALDAPGVDQVTVVEIDADLVRWNRTHLTDVHGDALADPRVDVVVDDVVPWLREGTRRFDVACFDIDNGPGWLVRPGNAWLYGEDGLRRVRERLTTGGAAAFWSAAAAPAFASRLAEIFGAVDRVDVPHARGEPDRIYLVTADAGRAG